MISKVDQIKEHAIFFEINLKENITNNDKTNIIILLL